MKYEINDKEIDRFWNWFSKNCQSFGEKFKNKSLLSELDAWITRLGDFSWEVGPGEVEENALVISPNGNLQMLEYSKAIVAKAVKCESWEYYYAKPPKKWELKFNYNTTAGSTIHIDATDWEYVLLKYEDGKFEIIIKGSQLMEFNDQDRLVITEIVLDGILGEELRMQLIRYIDVVEEFEETDKRGINNIKILADHLSSL